MKTWQWLGYLGLIPFLVCLWLFETDSTSLATNLSFNPQQGFVYYSAIILSFLSGAYGEKNQVIHIQKRKLQVMFFVYIRLSVCF